jgi:hypothetical protein
MYLFESKQEGLPYCNFIKQGTKGKKKRRNNIKEVSRAGSFPSMNKGFETLQASL